MNSTVWGLLAMLGITFINIGFLLPSDKIKNNITLNLLFIRIVFVLLGLLSLISFLIPNLSYNKDLIKNAKKNIDIKVVLFLVFSLFFGMILTQIAFSKGGSIAVILINLNLILLILFGMEFLKEKTNLKMWLGIIVYILTATYITYQKSLINK